MPQILMKSIAMAKYSLRSDKVILRVVHSTVSNTHIACTQHSQCSIDYADRLMLAYLFPNGKHEN